MKFFLWILAICMLAGCRPSVHNNDQTSNNNDSLEKAKQPSISIFVEHFESHFKTKLNTSGCPGAAMVIVKDSSIVLMKSYGIKEIGKADSITAHTMFRIASLSKGFTGILASIMVEQQKFSLEDPVIDYIPSFQLNDTGQTKRVKIKHLLSHSTGLPEHTFGEMIEDGKSLDDMLKKLKKVPLKSEEGKLFAYQNFTMGLMDKVFRSASGKNFNELIRSEIFDKAGMHATTTYEDMVNAKDVASPHDEQRNGFKVREIHDKYYNVAAAGGINASITDMSKWLMVLLGNRPDIASEKVLDRAFSPLIDMNAGHESENKSYYQYWDGVNNSKYAMGWRVIDYGNRKIYQHSGNVNSYRSEIAIDRKNKIGFCILLNAPVGITSTITPEFFNFFDFYNEMNKLVKQE